MRVKTLQKKVESHRENRLSNHSVIFGSKHDFDLLVIEILWESKMWTIRAEIPSEYLPDGDRIYFLPFIENNKLDFSWKRTKGFKPELEYHTTGLHKDLIL